MKKVKSFLIIICVFLLSGLAHADIDQGLVAFYPFNGNANDESGNGNHGTVNGATLTEDRFGNLNSAYNFDGDDTIKLFESYTRLNQESFAVWAKVDDLTIYENRTVYHYFLNLGYDKYFGSFRFIIRYSTYGFARNIYSDPYRFIWDTDDLDTDWHLFVYTRNGDSHKFYKDGNLVGTITDFDKSTSLPLELSHHPHAWYPYYFYGRLDDVRIYNRTLSEADIRELYYDGYILEDTMAPSGAVHAYPNLIWQHNDKMVKVLIEGRVMDEMGIAREGGHGVSSAKLLIDGTDEIILLDDTINLLDAAGYFSVDIEVKAAEGAEYLIELYAADTNPAGSNSGLVDTTYVQVSHKKKEKE